MLEAVGRVLPDLKIREEGWVQGARNTETGMYRKYMRISSTAQRRITSHLAVLYFGSLVEWLVVPSDALRSNF